MSKTKKVASARERCTQRAQKRSVILSPTKGKKKQRLAKRKKRRHQERGRKYALLTFRRKEGPIHNKGDHKSCLAIQCLNRKREERVERIFVNQ